MELILIYTIYAYYQKRIFYTMHVMYSDVAPASLKTVTKVDVWSESPLRAILSAWT